MCDIRTSQIRAGSVKMDEYKHVEHEDIKKKVDIVHIWNGLLARIRNFIFLKRFPGHVVDS